MLYIYRSIFWWQFVNCFTFYRKIFLTPELLIHSKRFVDMSILWITSVILGKRALFLDEAINFKIVISSKDLLFTLMEVGLLILISLLILINESWFNSIVISLINGKKSRVDGTWTHNLLVRSQTPYPLGHDPWACYFGRDATLKDRLNCENVLEMWQY